MPSVFQEGVSKIFENATFQNAAKKNLNTGIEFVKTQTNGTTATNVLEIFLANLATIKTTYKVGSRLGVSLLHLTEGGSIYYPPFICNIASSSCGLAAIVCRSVDKYRPTIALSLLADGLSICGDVIAEGGTKRPSIRDILF